MDFDRLSAFRAVARERGFSKAARRLYKTQPAVSQSVAALEDELGVRLFHRLARSVELTKEGQVLLEHVEESFAVLDRGRARLESMAELLEGELSIACSDTTACWLLPPVLGAFRERFPGVELRISNRPSPAAVAQVAAREVDIGFVTLPVAQSGLEVEPLATREDVAIFAPDHPLGGRKRISLERLLDEPLLLLDRGSQTRRFIDERIRECGPGRTPRVAMELASIEVIKRLVQLGLGVSIVPEVAVREEVRAGTLACVRVFARAQARTLGAIHPPRLTPAAAEFLALCREQLR